MFSAITQLILYKHVSNCSLSQLETYVVVVDGAHTQAPRSLRTAAPSIPITNDVLEGIATTPFRFGSSAVSLHWIVFGKSVP